MPWASPATVSPLSALAPDDWQSGSADESPKVPGLGAGLSAQRQAPGAGQPVHAAGPGPYPDADGRGGAAGPGAGPVTQAALQAARDVFYKGDVARRMVQALHDLGGLYTYEDFAEYTSPLEEPLSTTYRGYQLFTNRTWTQGITLLQTLNILEGYDLAAMGHNSPRPYVQVEALKLAFADREAYVGDPAHVDVPVEGLLSRYAALRRGLIDPNQAQAVYPPGDPRKMLAVAPDYRRSRQRRRWSLSGATQTVPRTWPQ